MGEQARLPRPPRHGTRHVPGEGVGEASEAVGCSGPQQGRGLGPGAWRCRCGVPPSLSSHSHIIEASPARAAVTSAIARRKCFPRSVIRVREIPPMRQVAGDQQVLATSAAQFKRPSLPKGSVDA